MREFKIYEILFENSLRNFYNLYFIPPRAESVQLKVIYFVRNVTSFLRATKFHVAAGWLGGGWWVLVVSKLVRDSLQHPHSLLGTAGHCEADHSPGLQSY